MKGAAHIFFYIFYFYFNSIIVGQSNPDFKIKIKSTDTINFNYMMDLKGYDFMKITEGKTNYFYKQGGGNVRFIRLNTFEPNLFGRTNLKVNDTIVEVFWFLTTLDTKLRETANFGHPYGKLTINEKSKTLRIQDMRIDPKYNFGTLVFKIIKFSAYEIILEDLKSTKFRRYHFRKSYSP